MPNLITKVSCYKCHKELEFEAGANIGRQEECPHCFASLRCCKMCQFYDLTAYNECREPSANRILEKEKANFCDYFKLGKSGGSGKDKDKLLDAANSLFKD